MGAVCFPAICKTTPFCTWCGYRGPKNPTHISTNNAEWMKKIAQENPNIRLSKLFIVGSHDAATYSIPKWRICSSAARTQNLNIYDQLVAGVRFFDLRMGKYGLDEEDVYVYHGLVRGGRFLWQFKLVKAFLDKYENEFVILKITQENRVTIKQLLHVLYEIEYLLGPWMVTSQDKWFNWDRVTIGELITPNKRVVCLVNSSMFGDGFQYFPYLERRGFFLDNSHLRNEWHRTRDQFSLFSSNLAELKERNSYQNKFFNSQMTLTPMINSRKRDYFWLCIGREPLRVDNLVRRLTTKDSIDMFLRDHAELPWNSIWFDFIDFMPVLVKYLIGLNYPYQLKIVYAAVLKRKQEPFEVTGHVQSFVRRNNSLYLVNLKNDLELKKWGGYLLVCYEIEGKGRAAKWMRIKKHFKFLINYETFLQDKKSDLLEENILDDKNNTFSPEKIHFYSRMIYSKISKFKASTNNELNKYLVDKKDIDTECSMLSEKMLLGKNLEVDQVLKN